MSTAKVVADTKSSASASAAGVAAKFVSAAESVAAASASAPTTNGTQRHAWIAAVGDPITVVSNPVPLKATQPGSAVVRMVAVDAPQNLKFLLSGAAPWKPLAPFIPGVGGLGVVESVADDVIDLKPGTVVVHDYYYVHSDHALLLTGGFSFTPNTPDGVKQIALWRNGLFAQYATLQAKNLIPVAPKLLTSVPVQSLLKVIPMSIAYGALIDRGRMEAGHTVLVGGATGLFGTATVLVALACGAETVYVTGRSAERLTRLTAISPRVKPVVIGNDSKSAAAAFTALGKVVDVFVDFFPFLPDTSITVSAINTLRRFGTAVLASGMSGRVSIPYTDFFAREIGVVGSLMYKPATVSKCLTLLGSGAIDTTHYVHTVYDGIDHITKALDDASKCDHGLGTFTVFPNGRGKSSASGSSK